MPRKSMPVGLAAGMPSGFVSNVTARNQFSHVRSKPHRMANKFDHSHHQQHLPRDAAISSSGSPYGKDKLRINDQSTSPDKNKSTF